jgi:hypothetical protein
MTFKFDPTLATHDLVQDLKWSRSLREEFAVDEAAVLDRYRLRPEERQAILRRDFHALYSMGLHAYLGCQFARLIYGNEAGKGAKVAVDALVQSLTRGGESAGAPQ